MLLDSPTYRTFLRAELSRRVRNNNRYSLRSFAQHLGMSPGGLSEILNGHRNLTLKAAHKVAKLLNFSPIEVEHFIELVLQEEQSSVPGEKYSSSQLKKTELSLELFSLISDWYAFAILNLIECDNFRSNERWIAKRLGISKFEVEVALNRLERLELIQRHRGKIGATKDYVISPDGIPSEAIRNHHREILKKAAIALDLQGVNEREVSGIGFALDPKYVPEIKKRINDFYDSLIRKYSKSGKRSEVYQCEIAFFRLTELTKEAGEV